MEKIINNKKLGFMQGRLVDSKYNRIQCFPSKNWTEEFKIAQEHKFTLMELTVNKVNIIKNPLYNGKIEDVIFLKKKHKIKIQSITCDYFMEQPFFKFKNKIKKNIIKNIFKIIKNSQKLKIKYFIIPLVDQSSIKNSMQEKLVINLIHKIIMRFKKIIILFETDYPPSKVVDFIKKFNTKRVGINYDTGNSAGLGYKTKEELKYFQYVKNIHLKDKKYKGTSVRLNTGDANIKEILQYAKKIRYKGNFILQTARRKKNEHVKELNINRNYLLSLNI